MKYYFAYIYITILCLVASVVTGCDGGAVEPPVTQESNMANLNISVSVDDTGTMPAVCNVMPYNRVPAAGSEAENDNEKMQTLRIVIVRPDGTVEHNTFINLKENPGQAVEKWNSQKFEVVTEEMKKIYLFVNEGLTTIKRTATADPISETPFPSFDGIIEVGKKFPYDKVDSLTVSISGSSDELTGPLPMNECHRVWMPKQDYTCTLFVTRAAVKFSFVFENQSGYDNITIKKLTLHDMLRTEYYMPRNAKYSQPGENGVREILSFDVPVTGPVKQNNNYYTFTKTFDRDGIELPTSGTQVLSTVYLLEGKYNNPAGETGEMGALNYSIGIDIGGIPVGNDSTWSGSRYLTNLPQLPRNTHVKVNAVIGQSEVTWTVEVLPYTAVPLDPVFGL